MRNPVSEADPSVWKTTEAMRPEEVTGAGAVVLQ